jgi:signal transduction histidine kinase
MSDRTPSDTMTLAGLTLANGPWLAVRLQTLAGHAGHPLPAEAAEGAVLGASRLLAQVLEAEGRPSANADHATDPAASLGRQQARLHRQAGMDMPASLKVLRLMRLAYDDLVRESWVDKDSRARAHEDVERFFERMLIGLCLDWAGRPATSPAAGSAETERLTALVARREDELRRTLDAARQASSALRRSRERATALAAELAAARPPSGAGAAADGPAARKAEFAAAQAQAQMLLTNLTAKAKALETRSAELEARLAQAQSALGAQREVEEAHELALKEIDNARADADAAREELRKARQQAQTAVDKAESQTLLARREAEEARTQALSNVNRARAEAEASRDELRTIREAHATLASEAEAMRAHLAETGSRLTSARRAEEAGLQTRLAQAQERVQALEAEAEETGKNIEDLTTRLTGLEELLAFKDERLREQSRAVAETKELLVKLGAAKNEILAQAQAAEAARDACASLLSTHLALTGDAVAAVDAHGAVAAWNRRFPELFGLAEGDRARTLESLLPHLAKRLQRPDTWLARVRELLADPASIEDGLTLASTTGQTLVFRSHPAAGPDGAGGRLFSFRDASLEHDMEDLVREIEAITRAELGQSLTAFIHLPQELLDDPAATPEQIRKLTVIRDSGYRIVNTVNMAMDIFRMERGLYSMPPGRTLDLAVVARRAAKDVSPLAASRHIDLKLLLGDSPLPPSATLPGPGDPIPAHALVLNLLRDALEAAPRQSSIQASLRLDNAAGLLCLDITRPGALNPDEQARLFDKPVGSEPGEGLARARYAARLMAKALGGSLTATTSTGSTTLALRLPKA